jgi:hypothetical protein
MPLIAALPVCRCLRLFALLLSLCAVSHPAVAADEDFLPVRSAYKVATSAEAASSSCVWISHRGTTSIAIASGSSRPHPA